MNTESISLAYDADDSMTLILRMIDLMGDGSVDNIILVILCNFGLGEIGIYLAIVTYLTCFVRVHRAA